MSYCTIYKIVPVICESAQGNKYYGDVPIANYNEITKQFEDVVNNRGMGYAGRLKQKYRKRKDF